MTERKSQAEWRGTLKDGSGTMKLGSGYFEGPFTYASRFEEAKGTNPEELIGAAHAGCFSMFLSALLGKAGYDPESIQTVATVYLTAGVINKIELDCVASVPGVSEEDFASMAAEAKEGCPVSNALGAIEEIVLTAKLK